MTLEAHVLIDGAAEGELVKLQAPICLWGGIEPKTGRIADPKHPDHGIEVSGRILAIPEIVGSSSSSQLLLELIYLGKHPAAIILGEKDAILGIASLVAREMAFGLIPILQMPLAALENGMPVVIEPGGRLTIGAPSAKSV